MRVSQNVMEAMEERLKNDYYEIAYNDLLYMQMTLSSDFY